MTTTAVHRGYRSSSEAFKIDLVGIDEPSLGLMLYGSQARGNARVDSDVDLLQIVDKSPRAYSIGSTNIAQYRPGTLLRMAQSGSLFVYHLKSEGRVLQDPAGILQRCLDGYVPPSDYSRMLDDIALASKALDTRYVTRKTVVACGRLGVYLLRTTMYIRAMQLGIHTFDIEKILDAIGGRTVREALHARRLADPEVSIEVVAVLRSSLSRELGHELQNEYGSIEALAIASSANPRVRPLMENLLAGRNSIDYSSLSFPPF